MRSGLISILSIIIFMIILLVVAAIVLKLTGHTLVDVGKPTKEAGECAAQCLEEGKDYDACFQECPQNIQTDTSQNTGSGNTQNQ